MKRDIELRGSTLGLSPLPFTSMLVNGLVQCLCGRGMRDPTQFWSNLSGWLFGVFYTASFAGASLPGTLRRHYQDGGQCGLTKLGSSV